MNWRTVAELTFLGGGGVLLHRLGLAVGYENSSYSAGLIVGLLAAPVLHLAGKVLFGGGE